MRRYRSILLITISLLYTQVFADQALPKNSATPGGIVTLPLNIASPNPPIAYYAKRRVAVIKGDETPWVAIVGIPLATKVGQQLLEINSPITQLIPFTIKKKRYRTQYIRLKNKRKIIPSDTDLKRITQEAQRTQQIIETWSELTPFQTAFSPPIKGLVTSHFGLRRIYNGHPRQPHAGLDIAAPLGTPVAAPAPGVVLATGNFFYTGNTIYIDHGQGLITLYAHLNTIDVKVNRHVAKGYVIGTVGQTGRATGPHLHWNVFLNQTPVDPLLFIKRSAFASREQQTKKTRLNKRHQ